MICYWHWLFTYLSPFTSFLLPWSLHCWKVLPCIQQRGYDAVLCPAHVQAGGHRWAPSVGAELWLHTRWLSESLSLGSLSKRTVAQDMTSRFDGLLDWATDKSLDFLICKMGQRRRKMGLCLSVFVCLFVEWALHFWVFKKFLTEGPEMTRAGGQCNRWQRDSRRSRLLFHFYFSHWLDHLKMAGVGQTGSQSSWSPRNFARAQGDPGALWVGFPFS